MKSDNQYIGIDVAKAKLDVHLGRKVHIFENTPKGFKRLAAALDKFSGKVQIICEASGVYHLRLLAFLQARQIEISVVNPRQVRDFAKAKGLLAKTDLIDARVLSAYGAAIEPRLTPALPDYWILLADLIDRREALKTMINAESNRLEHQHPQVAREIKSHLRLLNNRRLKVERELEELVKAHPELQARVEVMTQNKGIGLITALSMLAAMPELGTLNRTQAAALSGTAPLNRDSGTLRGHRTTWGGRPKIRSALYMSAIVASRHHPELKLFYQRLVAKGKKTKIALIAIMRKLIILLNTQLKSLNPVSI